MHAIVLDTETTGFEEPQPIEIAYVVLKGPVDLEITAEYCARFKPSKSISLGALATHHIMDEDLLDCEPHTAFKLPNVAEYLIGHNVDFDWEAIGKPDIKRIDTVGIARRLWPTADSHGLGALMYLLRRDTARELLKDAHSAAADVRNCVRLLVHMLPMLKGPKTWEELWQISESARIPEIMPFGKHKGMPIKDLPRDYKDWMLRQADMDPYVLKAVRGEK